MNEGTEKRGFKPNAPKRPLEEILKSGGIKVIPNEEFDRLEAEKKADQKRARIAALWKAANIPDRHKQQRKTGLIKSPEWYGAFQKVQKKLGQGSLIGLIGKRGTGKTQIAVEAIVETVMQERRAGYFTAEEMFSEFKAGFGSEKESEQAIYAYFVKFDLLVIDETGLKSDNDWNTRVFNAVIDRAYRGLKKDVILISNQERKVFDAAVGDSIVSRMNETGGVIECNWKSFRE